MILNPRWFTPTNITIFKEGEESQILPKQHIDGWGYQYEAEHVMQCLDQGLIESPLMNWEISLNLMKILDRIRIDAGIFFPGRDENLFF